MCPLFTSGFPSYISSEFVSCRSFGYNSQLYWNPTGEVVEYRGKEAFSNSIKVNLSLLVSGSISLDYKLQNFFQWYSFLPLRETKRIKGTRLKGIPSPVGIRFWLCLSLWRVGFCYRENALVLFHNDYSYPPPTRTTRKFWIPQKYVCGG